MLHKVDDILSKHALRRTAFRQELLKIFIESGSRALSQTDIEEALGDHDRITLYRTLKSFQDKGLIHEAVDGGKDTKYALCQNQCDVHHHIDHHPHFLCESCGVTYCMDEIKIPDFDLPRNYTLKGMHLALSGTCASCSKV